MLYLKDDDELMELKRKTSEMETVYDLGTKMMESVIKEKVQASFGQGDTIPIKQEIKSEPLEDVETLSYENNPMIFDEKNAKRDQTMEWLLTEKERFDSELDKNKEGFLNEVEIIALAIPDNNEITTDEVNHLFAGADEYKKRKLLHEVNFTAYKVSKGFEFKLTQNGSLARIYHN